MSFSCPHFGICGGCAYLDRSYEASKEIKEAQVRSLLEPALSLQSAPYIREETLSSPSVTGYRNKMEFTFGDECKDGPLALGMHKKRSFHDIVSVPECLLVDEDFHTVLRTTLDYFSPLYERGEVSFYHRKKKTGWLRHLLVRKAHRTGEILVDLVTTSKLSGSQDLSIFEHTNDVTFNEPVEANKPNEYCEHDSENIIVKHIHNEIYHDTEDDILKGYVKKLSSAQYSGTLTGILHTTNDGVADAIIDEGTDILYGTSSFTEELCGLQFRITPFSFFQTNTGGAKLIYETVRRYIRLALQLPTSGVNASTEHSGHIDTLKDTSDASSDVAPHTTDLNYNTVTKRIGTVYDLYSGTGTITQLMASVAEHAVGVEIVPEAVEAAKKSAALNGITNCTFLCGDVLKVLDDLASPPGTSVPPDYNTSPDMDAAAYRIAPPDLIILDPPRDGVHPKALKKILAYGVEHLIYISCKASSLARDLPLMREAGYDVKRLVCIDSFCWTKHIETVMWLENTRGR